MEKGTEDENCPILVILSYINDDSSISNQIGIDEKRIEFDYNFEIEEQDFVNVSFTLLQI